MEKIIIVGAGVAGLSCLNALLDKNISPLLVEAQTIGTPKMCGEFLAPDACDLLQRFDIQGIEPIHAVTFFSQRNQFSLHFPRASGAIARSEVERQLAQRARQLGGKIRENTCIQKIIPSTRTTPFMLHLTSGEILTSETVVFATGKFNNVTINTQKKYFPYFGIKMHVPKIIAQNTLLMHSVKNTYFGFVPISKHMSNFACIVKRVEVEKYGSLQKYFSNLQDNQPFLQQIFADIDLSQCSWLEGATTDFHLKKTPDWQGSCWIGDAIATLPPAIGSGFAHGIKSAIFAAKYLAQNRNNAYQQTMKKMIRSKLMFGHSLHQLFLHPTLSSLTISTAKKNRWLVSFFLKKLGYC